MSTAATATAGVPSAAPALFSRRVLVGLLFASGLMVPIGLWLRPVHLQWFDPTHFPPIAASMNAWIWSFRILVFGLFLRAAALAVLGTFPWSQDVRSLLTAGVTICALGYLVAALGSGYYMDTGVWGSWAIEQRTTPEARRALMDNLRPVNAWGECCIRMGTVFYSFGSIFVGLALLRTRFVPAWISTVAVVYGVVGICIGMFMANNIPANLGMIVVHAVWGLLLGVALMMEPRAS